MPKIKKIGLLGSGTVGQAIQELIFNGQGNARNEPRLEIAKIYTRHPRDKRWYSNHPSLFTTKPEEVIDHPDVDIVVEALGFQREEELANFKDYFIRAFQKGKSVVTSDKAVLAKFGKEIWSAAEKYGQEIRFEACVGGGIPIIRSLTQAFAAEEPEAIYGIMNGTCNYILSEMKKGGKSFQAALKEAQEQGYAETNPKADTSGQDAEAKLILLATVAFGLYVESRSIWRKGIEDIQAIDFLYAERKGDCTIKHLAVARNDGGSIQAFVSPMLLPKNHFLAAIDGPANAILFKGKHSEASDAAQGRDWNYAFVGPGAGGGPTAVAVMGDVYELARGPTRQPAPLRLSGKPGLQRQDEIQSLFYVRFVVRDRAGIVGDIGQTFGQAGIHISEIWQLNHGPEELKSLVQTYRLSEGAEKILPFVITLEQATVGQVKKALEIMVRKDYVLVEPVWFPMWGMREDQSKNQRSRG